MEDSKVQVSGALEFPFGVILKDTERSEPKKLNLKAIFRIEAPVLKSHHHRASIDLVVVLDVTSSSNEKQPSKLDFLKKAIGFVISNLDDGDRLAIVASRNPKDKRSSERLIEISPEGRKKLAKKLKKKLATVGFTEDKSSLKRAVKVLDDRSTKEGTRQGFIVLVSDGSEMKRPALGNYPVHTFGLGELHNPIELFLIANASNGTYSTITKNSEITEALAVCLALFKSVVAVDASIQLTHKLEKEVEKMETEIVDYAWKGGILYAGEVKHLFVDIECTFSPTTWNGIKHFRDLLTATATYKHAAQSEQSNSSIPMEVQCKLGVTVVCADPLSYGNGRYNTSTYSYPSLVFLLQMVRINVLHMCFDISNRWVCKTKCKAENANNHAQQVQGLGDDLETAWEEFKGSDKSWKVAGKIGLDLQLQRIESDIDAMVSGLKQQELGLGCFYSWLSSHNMQRASTTGCLALTTNASFLTPAIEDMVKKAQQEQSAEQGAGSSSTDSTPAAQNPSHPVSPPGERVATAVPAGGSHCNRAVQLLEEMSKRFEEWCKLDDGVPQQAFRPSSTEQESTTTVLRDTISRTQQYDDLYLTVKDVVNQWRESSQQQGQGFNSDDTPAPAL